MNTHHLLAKRNDYKTSHVLHLILSLLTAGLWVPFWILVSVSNGNEIRKIDKKLDKLHMQ